MMTSRSPLRLLVVLAALALVTPAHADPAKCQKTLLAGLRKYKKTYAKKAWEKCLDAENVGNIPGPCPDTAPITTAVGKINRILYRQCRSRPVPDISWRTHISILGSLPCF